MTKTKFTGPRVKIDGYQIGGKTGTSELLNPKGGYYKDRNRTSFIAVFPINNPKYVVYTAIENPKKELSNLLEVIKIIKNDDREKIIVTDYQVISVIMSIYDYSPSQVWFLNHVALSNKKSDHFKKYKKFLINHLNKNKTKIVYIIKPLWGGNEVFEEGLDKSCLKKTKITEILDSYLLQQCVELKH